MELIFSIYFAGSLYLLSFFVWGALNLSTTLAGRRAVQLWGSIVAYSALLTAARCGMHLAFTVGKNNWKSESRIGYVLFLLGFQPASSAWHYILVSQSIRDRPIALPPKLQKGPTVQTE